jgi:transcriptional regulator with XRE-family HTH domain
MPTRMPDPLDALVGARIRVFRIHRKISQTDLAEQIGVTFQQVQKYEKGTNRIGASRLSRIAAVLGISVGELFESPGEKSSDSALLFRMLAEPGALRVLKAYTRTSDPRVRHAIAELIETSGKIFNFAPYCRETRRASAKNVARANRPVYRPGCGEAS